MHFDFERCKAHIDDYNRGSYRGRSNTELDRDGYARFAAGLPAELAELTELVRFVGEDYGGAQARFFPEGYAAESARIAAALSPIAREYEQTVKAQPPLAVAVPDEAILATLLRPLHASKRWLVWATKFLHFLAPETFAVMDSRAEGALDFRRTGDPARDYFRFLGAVRSVMHDERETIDRLCAYDPESVTALKVVDKVLYEAGTGSESRADGPGRTRPATPPTEVHSDAAPSRVIETWITNIASHAERARSGDRYELCIPKAHLELFPEHKGWMELAVSGTRYRVQLGRRDGVKHLYLLTRCVAPDQRETSITALLRSVGLGSGDRPRLLVRAARRFELRTSTGSELPTV